MSNLEFLVRPFQSRDVAPPKLVVRTGDPIDPLNVSIGAPGGIAFVLKAFAVIEFTTDDNFTYREVSRQTSTKRINSESDPSQYIDVETVDRVLLKNKLNPDDKRIYEFQNGD